MQPYQARVSKAPFFRTCMRGRFVVTAPSLWGRRSETASSGARTSLSTSSTRRGLPQSKVRACFVHSSVGRGRCTSLYHFVW
eukprot:3848409-Pleurochrysis_carterae.AAC.6